jgi:hypothetical protein
MNRSLLLLAIFISTSAIGCMSVPARQYPNPMFIPANDLESVWERTVDVLHAYQLPIERENRLDGIIETDYKVGSGVLEPWHRDSVTVADRFESSFQSIRRRATISINGVQGGYLVGVEVLKELEDPEELIINSAGHATFPEATPLERDLDIVVGPATETGWILKGRDPNLEQRLLRSLSAEYSRTD